MNARKKAPPSLVQPAFAAAEFETKRRQKFLTLDVFQRNERWIQTLHESNLGTIARLRREGDLEPFGQHAHFDHDLQRLQLHYTAGDSIEDLLPLFDEVLLWLSLWNTGFSEYLEHLQREDPTVKLRTNASPLNIDESLEDFQTAISIASLAVLFGDAAAARFVADSFAEYLDKDMLLSGVLEPALPAPSSGETFYHRWPYDPLLDAAFTADTDGEASAFVKKYLDGWYKGFEGVSWHDGHLVHKEHMMPYYGYWSFEAAAVCVIYDIDDSLFREHLVYPKDLADWARRNDSIGKVKAGPLDARVSSSTRLSCLGSQPCPREGFWFTPARADSRRVFAQAEVMPEVGGDYGITIWQWDQQQT